MEVGRNQNLGFNGYICAKHNLNAVRIVPNGKPQIYLEIEEKAKDEIYKYGGKDGHIIAGEKNKNGVVLLISQKLHSMDAILKEALTKLGYEAEVVPNGVKPFDVFKRMKKELKNS